MKSLLSIGVSLSLLFLFSRCLGGSGKTGLGSGEETGKSYRPPATPFDILESGYPDIRYNFSNGEHEFKLKSSGSDGEEYDFYYIITKDEIVPKEIPLQQLVDRITDSNVDVGAQVIHAGMWENIGNAETTESIELASGEIYHIHLAALDSDGELYPNVYTQLIPSKNNPAISKRDQWHCGLTRTDVGTPSKAIPLYTASRCHWKLEKNGPGSLKITHAPNFNSACDPLTGTNRFLSSNYRYRLELSYQPILGTGPRGDLDITKKREVVIDGLPSGEAYRVSFNMTPYGDGFFAPGGGVAASDISSPIELFID
ncbi:MAG: hypothetical protein OXB88_08885 [Bacteriovoracales bacterium]|nr:hypothetical protein [Bacteriovoracales bacterium]